MYMQHLRTSYKNKEKIIFITFITVILQTVSGETFRLNYSGNILVWGISERHHLYSCYWMVLGLCCPWCSVCMICLGEWITFHCCDFFIVFFSCFWGIFFSPFNFPHLDLWILRFKIFVVIMFVAICSFCSMSVKLLAFMGLSMLSDACHSLSIPFFISVYHVLICTKRVLQKTCHSKFSCWAL